MFYSFQCEPVPSHKMGGNSKMDISSTILTMTTFGVDLDQHLFQTGNSIPTIVCKCVEEIDKRGLLIKVSNTNLFSL